MDTQRDFKPFQDLMDELNAAYREGFNASDAQVRAYWDALKDIQLTEVRANVKRLIATATKESALPRPASLRNRPPGSVVQPPSASEEKAARESIRRWREFKQRNPVAFEVEFRSSRAFTALAQCEEDSPEHEEWLREWRRWEALRYVSADAQAAAVAKYRQA